MTVLTHQLERSLVIEAPRDVVFRYFTDPGRWAAWWGAGSTIDARPGGRVFIRYPNAVEASGDVLDISAPDRIVFTLGYAGNPSIPHGASRVTIALEAVPRGTRLRLRHEFAGADARDQHVQGWRYQLSLFANVVANERHAGAAALADAWFKVWDEADPDARMRALARIASPGVRLHDKFSCVEGLEELSAHIAGAQRFMPGVTMTRRGDTRQCQGTMLADWSASRADGQPLGNGVNVFMLGPDGLIESVTGFWQ